MFERFTQPARAVVASAQEEARSLGHGYIGTEHLLLGLARPDAGLAAEVLATDGVTSASLRTALVDLLGTGHEQGAVEADDARALATLGIDLEAVRARVEELFGPGALDRPLVPPSPRRRRRRWRLRRRQTCRFRAPRDHIPFTPRSKKVLELSLRESLALGHDWIGAEHILLGLIREGEGVAVHLLVRQGEDLQDLRRRLLDRLRDVA